MKILWQYFLIRIFLFFILFFFLSFHSPPHTCPLSSDLYPPSFIFFFSSRTFQQPHLLHIRERERERAGSDRQKDKADAPASFVHSALPNLIGIHHVALPRPLPHCHSSSSPPLDWVRSACSSYLFIYFHICLF